jgi:Uma2 family endonuclease
MNQPAAQARATVPTIDDDMMTTIAAPSRPLGPWANGMIMSEEEFDAVTNWNPDYRYELLHGVLIVSPAPDFGERGPNDELAYLLRFYQYQHPQGAVLNETVSEQVIQTSAGRRRADRVVWIGLGRKPDLEQDVPAIVIEFVSDSTRDRRSDHEEKRQEYADIGVKEYWVIDRFRRIMTVYRPQQAILVSEHEIYRSELLPGFELCPARLFAVAEGRQP